MRLLGLITACACAALALGCPGESPPTGSDETTGTTGTTGGSATGSTTGPDLTTTGTDEGTTAAPGSSSGEGTSSGGGTTSGSTGSGSDSGSSTGEGISACASGCAVEFACGEPWASEEECTVACEANLVKAGRFSRFCQLAWESLSECLGTLGCEEYAQWQSPMAFPYPCSDADVALEIECEGQ